MQMLLADRDLTSDIDTLAPNVGDQAALMAELPAWRLVSDNESQRLQRRFTFDNYAAALAFTATVGDLAMQANHSPVIITASLAVTIIWGSRRDHGLQENDFILAAKTERLYRPA